MDEFVEVFAWFLVRLALGMGVLVGFLALMSWEPKKPRPEREVELERWNR